MSHRKMVSRPEHKEPIGFIDGKPIELNSVYQDFFDDLQSKLNQTLFGVQITLHDYVKADLPSPVPENGWIQVTDEIGGSVPAYADGSNWRRASDGAIVS